VNRPVVFPWAFPVLLALTAGATLVLVHLPEVAPRLVADGALALDGPALCLLGVLAATVLAAGLLGLASRAREAHAYAVLLAALAALTWAAASSSLDLAAATVFWAAGWILAAAAVGRLGGPEPLEAAVKLHGLGAAGTLILMLGAVLAAGLAGTSHLLEAGQLLTSLRDSPVLARTAARVLMVGMALAAAWVPFHLWAPDGLSAARRPVALILAVAAPLAATLALARLLFAFEPALAALQINWRGALFAFAALTALVGGSVALAQRDAARLTAYFTVVQCAELIPALGTTPGDAHLLAGAAVAHLLALVPVWLALGAWADAAGGPTDFARLAGWGRSRAVPALLWVSALGLAAGFPGGARFALRPALAQGVAPSLAWPLLLALSAIAQWAVVMRLARVLFLDAPQPAAVISAPPEAPAPAASPIAGAPPASVGAGAAQRSWPAWVLVALALACELWIALSGRLLPPGGAAQQILFPGG
jgi:NADH:ubiquinone oxidoreductase subunit 2 (subunit N)